MPYTWQHIETGETISSPTRPKGNWQPVYNTRRVLANNVFLPYRSNNDWAIASNRELATIARMKFERGGKRTKASIAGSKLTKNQVIAIAMNLKTWLEKVREYTWRTNKEAIYSENRALWMYKMTEKALGELNALLNE